MSPLRWPLRIFLLNLAVIWGSFYWARLRPIWVAVQLILVSVPALLLHFQTRDAKGRPIPEPKRRPGVRYIGPVLSYSQAGGKFAVLFCLIVGTLLDAVDLESWWPRIGLVTGAQVLMVKASLVVATGFLLVYICRRWPDEPREDGRP